ncbi:hypothetical protein FisN_7Hh033 [Fistulifera solaris]|uniref:Uncharacterized protein n=1 Tax=Fistulifera solaris TaxID=1519565 RepID=A0A1Z5K394_FISSO|nr:hypothetical protein FisN_7Hh033 [Fistulifera solaris]|eukprot:GAX20723.1 hypothetical protein FisN_7Hh033 [Fistulifera solaris]
MTLPCDVQRWKIVAFSAFLLLGLTRISIEQWRQLTPAESVDQKDESNSNGGLKKTSSLKADEEYTDGNIVSIVTGEIRKEVKDKENLAVNKKVVKDDEEFTIGAFNEDAAHDTGSTTPQSSIDFIRANFPECLSKTGIIDLKNMGSYLPVLPGVQPRYNHYSCFVMKARYNCAHPPDYDKPEASDYELVFNLGHDNNTKPCRLRSLVDALGGPAGLSRRPTLKGDTVDNPPTRIAIHGSSYVRQMWEAMVCGFREDITALQVKNPGPSISLSALKKRGNKPIEFSEIGKPIRGASVIQQKGCHGAQQKDLASFYHPSATQIPDKTMSGCDDGIAMVRFQNVTEVYYVFRSQMLSENALNRVYSDYFQIPLSNSTDASVPVSSKFDALVWNVSAKKPKNTFPKGVTARYEFSVAHWLPTLKVMQRRDLGIYFGADNPWITKPPDGHPCMPGIPDDEVNLLLYVLFTGYTIK